MAARSFDATPDAPRKVRAYVLTALAAAGCDPDVLDDAMLCASELATAGLADGGERLAVAVWGGGVIHVEVHHETAKRASELVPWRQVILDALTEEWGDDADEGGTTRWFDIACPPPPDPQPAV